MDSGSLSTPHDQPRAAWTLTAMSALLRPSWGLLLAAFAANVVAALFEGSSIGLLVVGLQVLSAPADGAMTAALSQRLLGWFHATTMAREPLFLTLVLLAVAAQMFRSGFQFLGTLATATLQVRAQCALHHRLLTRLMSLSFSRVSGYRLGELAEYLNQARNLHEMIMQLNVLISQGLLGLIYVVLLCWISWPMTLGALVLFWGVSRVMRLATTRVHHYASRSTDLTLAFSQRMAEYLQGLRLLHTFARQPQVVEAMDRSTQEWMASRRLMSLWHASIPMMMDTATVLGVAVFLVGGYVIADPQRGSMLPRVLAFLLALYRMTPRLRAVHASMASLAMYGPSLEGAAVILGEREEPPRTAGWVFRGLHRAIELQHVSLRYRPDEPQAALSDVSLTIPRGGFVALVGASGAGKSSIANVLIRLYAPTSGRILVDGLDLQALDVVSWRERLGVVSQDSFLFHASLTDNIAFGKPTASREEIIAAATAAHAHEFISRLAAGYETLVGERGAQLSGGQRQQIALARALVRQPEVLILDEATSALDSESERHIQEALEEQRGVRTVLVIAHRLSTIAHADQIVVLDEGRVIEQGTHDALLARGGSYAQLWQLQAEPSQPKRPAALEVST